MLDMYFSSMALAVATFSLFLLLPQHKNQAKRPLVCVLTCLALLASGPFIFSTFPAFRQLYIAAIPVIFYILLPCFWLYHEALISPTPWKWHKNTNKHFLPLLFALLVSLFILLLPEQDFDNLFFSEIPLENTMAKMTATSFFALLVLWCALSLVYVIGMFKRTIEYRSRIKQMYANESGKTLLWVHGFSLLLVFTWIYALAVLAVGNHFAQYGLSDTGVFLLLLVLVWLMATNGLRQQPGFAEVFSPEPDKIEVGAQTNKAKYQRSALNQDDFERIATKLVHAISQDALHLDAELNLLKLAKHTGVPSQYLSQTLNQHLDTTFFDFINQARIENAKPMLLKSDQTVLDIALAVGFNARSSFYKAFKQSTGMTPSEYKKQHNAG